MDESNGKIWGILAILAAIGFVIYLASGTFTIADGLLRAGGPLLLLLIIGIIVGSIIYKTD